MTQETESMSVDSGTVALLNKSEIDMQIATAHRYPRSVAKFRKEAMDMVTISEAVAEECVYALPRKEKNKDTGAWEIKTIEGPSARFAEVICSAWGNSRAGARVVSDVGEFVTAQGVMHDLERNVAITFEVQRRIVGSNGQRYKPDMIGVTANAASSIALRNAILKVIPKAFWADIYEGARQTIMGTYATLNNRRSDALAAFLKRGVSGPMIFAHFGVKGVEDITLEHLVTLRGLLTAIKDGDTTPEQIFSPESGSASAKPKVDMPQAKAAPAQPAKTAAASADPATGETTPPPAKAASTTGAMATEGERKLIITRAKNNHLDIASLIEQAGLTGLPDDLTGLTKDGFVALKDLLPKAA